MLFTVLTLSFFFFGSTQLSSRSAGHHTCFFVFCGSLLLMQQSAKRYCGAAVVGDPARAAFPNTGDPTKQARKEEGRSEREM